VVRFRTEERVVCLLRNVQSGSVSYPVFHSVTTGERGSFLVGKTAGAWRWTLSLSSVEFKN